MSDPTVQGTQLRFGLLGPLEVLQQGRPTVLGGPRQRAVLAMLLIHANRVIQLDRLADAVWDGNPPEGSVTTVQTYVHHLRQALEPERPRGAPAEVLVRRDHGYLLSADRSQIDSAAFEDQVSTGCAALVDGRQDAASAQLQSALALWRGPVLADLADYDFVRIEAARLEELRLVAVEAWVEAELGLGHHEMLTAELNRLATEHPLRERLHAQRVLALYRSGRQAEALSAYQQVRTRLVDELGIDAGEPLVQLHQQVLNHDPVLDWRSQPVRPIPVQAQPSDPYDGRAGETTLDPLAGSAVQEPPRKRSLRNRRVALASAAAMAMGLLVVVLGLTLPRDNEDPTAIYGDSAGALDSDGKGASAIVPAGHGPDGIAYGSGAIWVANTSDGTVSRIDPGEKRQVETIPVESAPGAIAIVGSDVWVANSTAGTVSRINVDSNTVVDTIRVGNQPSAVAVGDTGVWVTNAGDGTVSRIDPGSDRPPVPVDVGEGPDGVAVGADAVWVANGRSGTVMRINPTTGIVVKEIHVGAGPSGIALGPGAVWVTNSFSQSVSRIDPSSNEVADTITVGDGPRAITVLGDNVWVANEFDATLQRIDARTGEVSRTVRLGGSPRALVAAGSRVWVSSREFAAESHTGGTLVVASDIPPGIEDPALSYDAASVIYDHLVGYRATGGAAGLTLVPDLAMDLPQPTDGGKTYTFVLRPGLRYSTGQVVRPGDIKRGVEREFTTGGGDTSYYEGIVGASTCLPPAQAPGAEAQPLPAHCDLSTGVLVDDKASTVSFRLEEPDPDFLFKLALFIVPTPLGTRPTPTESQPIPGTGPYMPAIQKKGEPFTLVRNPHFHPWSYAAQPPGYPDAIRWMQVADRGAAVAAVASDQADLVALGGDQPDPLGELAKRFPTRVYQGPADGTQFEFLNTQLAPFKNPLARQAVSYAVDRGHIADLMGGPRHALPTCQLLPPNLPGYQPYCRYTVNPRPGGGWQGPNVDKARELVRASGTADVPIQVWGSHDPFWAPINAYFVQLLEQIGYHNVRLHETPNRLAYFDKLVDPNVHMQVGTWIWGADFPVGSNFFIWSTCHTPKVEGNHADYCNRTVDSLVESAKDVETTAPAEAGQLWAEADRRFSDDAAYVPLVSFRHTSFVSARVSNFQDNPHTGPLIDQMWVR
jgi:YVTN family beta-propeller protein